jgi:hypothetical protein
MIRRMSRDFILSILVIAAVLGVVATLLRLSRRTR